MQSVSQQTIGAIATGQNIAIELKEIVKLALNMLWSDRKCFQPDFFLPQANDTRALDPNCNNEWVVKVLDFMNIFYELMDRNQVVAFKLYMYERTNLGRHFWQLYRVNLITRKLEINIRSPNGINQTDIPLISVLQVRDDLIEFLRIADGQFPEGRQVEEFCIVRELLPPPRIPLGRISSNQPSNSTNQSSVIRPVEANGTGRKRRLAEDTNNEE